MKNKKTLRYKCVKQQDMTDCAAACIATICLQYKKEMTITKLRDLAGTDIRGTNFIGIVKTLEELGFEAKPIKITKDTFFERVKAKKRDKFTLPAIAEILTDEGLTHAVVVHKITKKKIILSDPALGIIKKNYDEFFKDFNGNIILCVPKSSFIADKIKTGSVFNRFVKLVLAQKVLLTTAIIASLILTILGIASSFFNKILMDEILPYGLKNSLLAYCIGFGVIGIFNILLGSARQHLLLHLSIKIDIPLMLGYFKHIFSLPMKFFGTRRTGDILTRFQDANTIKEIFTTVTLTILIDIIMAIVTGIILFVMNKILFGIIALITVFDIILVYIFKRPYKEYNYESMKKQAALSSQVIDSLKGVETVKSFGVEEDALEEIEKKFISNLRLSCKINITSNIQGVINGFFSNIGNLVLMGIGALFVIDNKITLGSLMAFMSLAGYFMDPLKRLVSLQMQIQEASIAMKRMSELYDIKAEQAESQKLLSKFEIGGEVNIYNVSFRYGTREEVLKEINIKIPHGSKIALVGNSGGGKTTLAKLILGLYKPEKGRITINGYNIEELNLKTLRQKIAYVPQNVELFSGTVEDNIKLGNRNASYEEMKEACKRAGCEEFIMKLPAKYGTYLEEAGGNLSGGERQRLALARALIKKPKILIMDESTSNLDFMSEAEIYKNIFNMDCTIIIIAHRLSTIRRCDNIYVLDKARIAEEGKHKKLLDKKGVYYKIWTSQVGEDRNVSVSRNSVDLNKNKKTKSNKLSDFGDEMTYS